jgi:hypothetical protein
MTEKLKQTIKEEMDKLPKETQNAINSLDWGNIVEEIGKKYLLNESEVNDLQVETMLVLFGIEELDSYTQNIENEVGISKEEAEKIAKEVNQKIFNPIYDILTKNIEDKIKTKNPSWKQTLDFIVSGGDYSVFMKKDDNPDIVLKAPKINTLDNSSKIADIKSRFTI